MRAACFAASLVLAAGLQLQGVEFDTHPKYAMVGDSKDIEVVWQRPSGPVKGAFMYLHGCGNRALDMWATKGKDGFHFKECNNTKKGYCAGLPQEGLLKSTARQRGYIVIAVQGGASSNRGCFHEEDVPRIKQGLKHVWKEEKLGDKQLIMAGMSAGGRVIGDIATSTGGAGVPTKCAAIMVAEMNMKAAFKFPTSLPVSFWHMSKDGLTEKLIGANLRALKKRKCLVEDHEIFAQPVTKEFLMAGGHGLNKTTAEKAMAAFTKADLFNAQGNLKMDPYNPKPKTRWMKAIEAAEGDLRGEIGGFGQQSTVTKLMERSWASHALAADKTNEIIDFCEKEHVAAAEEPAKKETTKKKK